MDRQQIKEKLNIIFEDPLIYAGAAVAAGSTAFAANRMQKHVRCRMKYKTGSPEYLKCMRVFRRVK